MAITTQEAYEAIMGNTPKIPVKKAGKGIISRISRLTARGIGASIGALNGTFKYMEEIVPESSNCQSISTCFKSEKENWSNKTDNFLKDLF